ncbi:MAG: hypothetical protein HKO84_01540, partial [Pseudomonadales bacterium]|nr:hypothetical protein [Pseudomonadales bacterium]
NAIKYNDKVEKKIDVDAELVDGFWYINISDNGIGIEDEHFGNIFEFFQRLHGQNEYGGGSGAGLAIVKKIVEQAKGNISVVSQMGQGSCFAIKLPAMSPVQQPEQPGPEKKQTETPFSFDGNPVLT